MRLKGFLKRKKSGRRICCYGVRPLSVPFPVTIANIIVVVALDKRQEKLRTEAAEASTGTGSAGPTRHPTEEMDVDSNSNHPLGVGGGGGGAGAGGAGSGDGEGGKDGKEGGKDHGQHPPAKRYRLTDTMKSIVWELVLLSNECCRLENEKKLVFDDCICRFF